LNNPVLLVVVAYSLLACGGATPTSAPAASAPAASAPAANTHDEAVASPEGARTEARGASAEEGDNVFQIRESDTAGQARGVNPSKIKPSRTEAALRLFVIDKENGPIEGIVISVTAPSGTKYYTEETDAAGYAELLVPVGQTYELTYLTLGRRDFSAKVTVSDEPNQNLKLTLRYRRVDYPGATDSDGPVRRFVLQGVQFETGKARLLPESFERLESVVEFMTYKKSARVEISGHTDSVGKPRDNQRLSERRARAVRDYLVSKGIARDRIETVGYGSERPIASNDTEEGRQQNRRIEATEL
jgi:outer membrane protein OmpA-like peptidoglycan-associated protein